MKSKQFYAEKNLNNSIPSLFLHWHTFFRQIIGLEYLKTRLRRKQQYFNLTPKIT